MTKHNLSYNDKVNRNISQKTGQKKRVYHRSKMIYPLFFIVVSTPRQYHSPWGQHLFPVSRPF